MFKSTAHACRISMRNVHAQDCESNDISSMLTQSCSGKRSSSIYFTIFSMFPRVGSCRTFMSALVSSVHWGCWPHGTFLANLQDQLGRHSFHTSAPQACQGHPEQENLWPGTLGGNHAKSWVERAQCFVEVLGAERPQKIDYIIWMTMVQLVKNS